MKTPSKTRRTRRGFFFVTRWATFHFTMRRHKRRLKEIVDKVTPAETPANPT
jgi:hypothetical protein